jgi:RNA polymerase subunit RPABC4/transcription elongation factor Spt4
MAKPKACTACRKIFEEGAACPDCGEGSATETIKGRVYVFDSEKSEIATNMKIKRKGQFAIKTK